MPTPKLRFADFTGEWTQTTFDEIASSFDYGMNAAAKEFDGENQYLRITDIDEETRQYFTANRVSPDSQLSDEYLLNEGDIVFARTGASTGKTYIYNQKDGKMYFAGFLIRLKVNSKAHPKFIYYQTLRSEYYKWVKVMSMRSGQPGINAKEYSTFTFNIPELDEQQKIADFFTLMDRRIEKQQEKVQTLREQRKGLLQKIFSQELRLKNKRGEEFPSWNSIPLGQIGTTFSGLSGKTKEDFGTGDSKYITYMNVFKNIIINDDLFEKVLVTDNENQNRVQTGDILFTTSSETPDEVGMASVWLGNEEDLYLNSFCFGFRLSNNLVNPLFLAYQLRSAEIRKRIILLAQGSTRYNLSKNQLLKINVFIPDMEEQQLIVTLLSTFEKRIELEDNKLDLLIEQKKGFMQQMFI